MDAKQYEALVVDAENRLKRLRALYDQWFAGIERLEPQQLRRELDTVLTQLRREQTRNTALKFRFNQVVQRYTTYTTYWRRIARQIEEGTYKRDVLRARRLTEQLPSSEPPPPRKDGYELDIDVEIESAVDGALGEALRAVESPPAAPAPAARLTPRPLPISPFAMPSGDTQPGMPFPEPARSFPPPAKPAGAPPMPAGVRPGAPPIPPGAAKRPPPPPPAAGGARPAPPAATAAPSGIADDHMRKIYERYVEARRQNQESTTVKFESVASSVRGMMPKLMQKHAGKNIDFEIVVKDGKVALKPVAR
jgi:hypothetical protein